MVALLACALILQLSGRTVHAQDTIHAVEVTILNATEDRLWLVDTHPKAWRQTLRKIQTKFARPVEWNGHVVQIAPYSDRMLAFFDDGSVYRSSESTTPTPEPSLPGNRPPVDVAGVAENVFVLLRMSDASALTRPATDDTPTTQEDRSGPPGRMCVATLEAGAWKWVADCPASVLSSDSPAPRLSHHGGALLLADYDDTTRSIRTWKLDTPTATWHELDAIPCDETPQSLWLCVANRAPTLISVTRSGAAAQFNVYRRMPGKNADESHVTWRISSPQWSAAPDGFSPIQLRGAAGFNQHLVVLAVDAPGRAVVQFGRFDGESIEQSIDVRDIFDKPDPIAQVAAPLQMLTFFVVVIVFSLLFTLRRGAMLESAVLPPGWELALTTQRLIAGAIDFLPFSVAAAILLRVSWTDAFKQIGQWALGTGFDSDVIDPIKLLIWWGMSSFGYVLYSLIMELITQRTVGKVIMGLRLLSDVGTRPAMWQIVLRNGMRLVELLPPVWVLVFLVVLSRNRQRLGDIFARVVVVRQVKVEPNNTPPSTSENEK